MTHQEKEERNRKILMGRLKGVSIQDLAIQHNMDSSSVSRVLTTSGIREKINNKLPKTEQKLREKEILFAYIGGDMLEVISEKHKLSISHIRTILKSQGLQFGINALPIVERDQRIRQMAISGDYTNRQIAEITGLATVTVCSILRNRLDIKESDSVKFRNGRLLELWNSGEFTTEQLSIRFGICRQYLMSLIRQNGGSPKAGIREVQRKRVMKLFDTGKYSLAAISRETGLKHATITGLIDYKGIRKDKHCDQCGEPLKVNGRADVHFCDTCRKLRAHTEKPERILCVECGISHPVSTHHMHHKKPESCSIFCDMAKRKREKSIRNRAIRKRAEKLREAEFGISKREISRRLSKEFQLSPGGIMGMFQQKPYEPPPLGWSSDNAVLRMNQWAVSETKMHLLLDAKAFREARSQDA